MIPVLREEIEITKRSRPLDHVRVHKRVLDARVPVELVTAREHIDVERVQVDRVVTSMPEVRVEGETTIVPVVEEIVLIEKRLILKEEIRITKSRTEEKRVVEVPVKREQVHIERALAEDELERREP